MYRVQSFRRFECFESSTVNNYFVNNLGIIRHKICLSSEISIIIFLILVLSSYDNSSLGIQKRRDLCIYIKSKNVFNINKHSYHQKKLYNYIIPINRTYIMQLNPKSTGNLVYCYIEVSFKGISNIIRINSFFIRYASLWFPHRPFKKYCI